MARLVSPSKSDQTRSMNQSGNGPSPSLPPAQSVRDDGIQPPRVGSAPVRSPARPAAEEPVVRAERAEVDVEDEAGIVDPLRPWYRQHLHQVAVTGPGGRQDRSPVDAQLANLGAWHAQ